MKTIYTVRIVGLLVLAASAGCSNDGGKKASAPAAAAESSITPVTPIVSSPIPTTPSSSSIPAPSVDTGRVADVPAPDSGNTGTTTRPGTVTVVVTPPAPSATTVVVTQPQPSGSSSTVVVTRPEIYPSVPAAQSMSRTLTNDSRVMQGTYMLTASANHMFAAVETAEGFLAVVHRDLYSAVKLTLIDKTTRRMSRAYTIVAALPSTSQVTEIKAIPRNGGLLVAYILSENNRVNHTLKIVDITLSGGFPVATKTVVSKPGQLMFDLQVEQSGTSAYSYITLAYLVGSSINEANTLEILRFNVYPGLVTSRHVDNFLSGKRLLDMNSLGGALHLALVHPRLVTNSSGAVTGYDWNHSVIAVRTHNETSMAPSNGLNLNTNFLSLVSDVNASAGKLSVMLSDTGLWVLRPGQSYELTHYAFGGTVSARTMGQRSYMNTGLSENYWAERWDFSRDGDDSVLLSYQGQYSRGMAVLAGATVSIAKRLDVHCPTAAVNPGNASAFAGVYDSGSILLMHGCKSDSSVSYTDLHVIR